MELKQVWEYVINKINTYYDTKKYIPQIDNQIEEFKYNRKGLYQLVRDEVYSRAKDRNCKKDEIEKIIEEITKDMKIKIDSNITSLGALKKMC